MNHHSTLRLLGLAGASVVIALPAWAQDDSYYSFGFGAGQSRGQFDEARITNLLLNPGLVATGITVDEHDTAYKVFAGYQFNRWFGMELGYFNLGRQGFTATTTPAGTLTGQYKLQGANLDLLGTLPITDNLSALARVGVQYARTRATYTGTGAVSVTNPLPSERETDYKLGLGLQYAFSRSVLLRGEVERYRVNDAVSGRGSINTYTVGLVFPFGRSAAPATMSMAAPVYVPPPVVVAAAPEPAPVVIAPPPPAPVAPPAPAPRRVSYAADSLFGFDQSTVGATGQAALDTFARELHGTRFETITVEGHTDRLGTPAYNDKLSLQRAEAVKAYLMRNDGLSGASITAVGKGESAPVTATSDCKGEVANKALITCLQPDRRVVVEVTGQR